MCSFAQKKQGEKARKDQERARQWEQQETKLEAQRQKELAAAKLRHERQAAEQVLRQEREEREQQEQRQRAEEAVAAAAAAAAAAAQRAKALEAQRRQQQRQKDALKLQETERGRMRQEQERQQREFMKHQQLVEQAVRALRRSTLLSSQAAFECWQSTRADSKRCICDVYAGEERAPAPRRDGRSAASCWGTACGSGEAATRTGLRRTQ